MNDLDAPHYPDGKIAVPCGCGCRRPAAFVVVVDGRLSLEITMRHGGRAHRTILRLYDIPPLLDQHRDR